MKHLSFSAGTREHRLLHFAEGGAPEKAEAPPLTIDTTVPMENVETKAAVDEKVHKLVDSADSDIRKQEAVARTVWNGPDLNVDVDAIQKDQNVQIATAKIEHVIADNGSSRKNVLVSIKKPTFAPKTKEATTEPEVQNQQPEVKESVKAPDVRDFSYAKELQERMNGMKGYEGTRVERKGTTNEYVLTNPDAATIQKLKDFAEKRGMKPEMKDGNLHLMITGHEQGLGFFGADKGTDFREKFQSTALKNSASKAADDVRDFSYAEELQERANGMRGYEGTRVERKGTTNEYVVTNENPTVIQELIQYGESRGMRPRIDEDGNLYVTIIGDEKGVGFYGPDREVKNEKPAAEPSTTTYASLRTEKPATTVKPPTIPSSTPVEEKKVDTPQEADTEKLAKLTESRIAAEQACNAGGAPSERMERYDALEAALQEEIQARFAIEGPSPELEALYAHGKNIVQKRSHVVVEYLREKLQEIIKREQSEVKRYEDAKANRTAFEYVTQGMSGMKTYDQEIAVSEQAIHSAERVRDRILGKAEELLTKTEVTQKELEELQKIATNVEENIALLNGKKVTHDIWETQEELIDRSRDISILIITAPTAFFTGGGSSAGLMGAMRVGGYMGARSAALHSGIVNTDEVASGNKTVSEGVIDTGIDTAIGGTVGAATGGAFNRAGAGISRIVNGKNVTPPPVSARTQAAPKINPTVSPDTRTPIQARMDAMIRQMQRTTDPVAKQQMAIKINELGKYDALRKQFDQATDPLKRSELAKELHALWRKINPQKASAAGRRQSPKSGPRAESARSNPRQEAPKREQPKAQRSAEKPKANTSDGARTERPKSSQPNKQRTENPNTQKGKGPDAKKEAPKSDPKSSKNSQEKRADAPTDAKAKPSGAPNAPKGFDYFADKPGPTTTVREFLRLSPEATNADVAKAARNVGFRLKSEYAKHEKGQVIEDVVKENMQVISKITTAMKGDSLDPNVLVRFLK